MSDDDSGNGKTGAFLLGMMMGMLLCLAAGGVWFVTTGQRQAAALRDAMVRAEEARAEAERARAAAAGQPERLPQPAKE